MRHGFTLVELSIVLVIIGLIAGGILVGQDMIGTAAVRSTIAQYEKFNTSVNSFRLRYNALPGDINPAQALAFDLYAFNDTGAPQLGDNNGVIQSNVISPNPLGIGETLMFWRHLSDTNMIEGKYGSSGNSLVRVDNGAPTGEVSNIAASLPPTKIERGTYFVVHSPNEPVTDPLPLGKNYYVITGMLNIQANGNYWVKPALKPTEAYNIDSKVDDGLPNTGVARSKGFAGVAYGTGSGVVIIPAVNCMEDGVDPASPYDFITDGDKPACIISLAFQ